MKYQHPQLIDGRWRHDEVLNASAHLFHEDSVPNGNFARQLEEIRAQAFEVQYPELKSGLLVPARQGLNPGAINYTYRVFDGVANARLLAPGQSRGESVEVFGVEATATYKRFGSSYRFDIEEVRNSAMSGNNLPAYKAEWARKALAFKLDDALLLGAAGPGDLKATGFVGLFIASNTTTVSPIVGVNGGAWSGKTPDEIVNDLIALENAIITNSNGVEIPDTLVLPLATKPQLQSRMGDGSDTTILKHYLSNTDSIKTVIFSEKLNSNAAWTGARVVMYKRDPNKIEGITSIVFAQGAPQYEGWDTITECEMKTAGTVVYFPKSIGYMDGVA